MTFNKNNKIALFLSALAIALIAILLIFVKGHFAASKASAAELSTSEAISEIYDYIDSLEGFSDSQKSELESAIAKYFNDSSVLTEEDLSTVYTLIQDKYLSNRDYYTKQKAALEKELSQTSSNDSAHYKELMNRIDELNSLIEKNDSESKTLKKNFDARIDSLADDFKTNLSEKIKSLSEGFTKNLNDSANSLTENFNKNLNDSANTLTENFNNSISETQNTMNENLNNTANRLTNTMNENDEALWAEINALKSRLSDNDKEYEFGYEDGCYGYRTVDGTFKPF